MSAEQIEAAYRHRKRQYEEEDCKAHLEDMSEMVDGECNLARFGISLEEALEYTEEITDMYERIHDCNLAENDMWEYTIENVLQRHFGYHSDK